MIIYGVCKSCSSHITIADVDEIPKKSKDTQDSLTRISCKRCGVPNIFKGSEIKAEFPKKTLRAFIEVLVLGVILTFLVFISPLKALLAFLIAILYVILATLYVYYTQKTCLAIQKFNRT